MAKWGIPEKSTKNVAQTGRPEVHRTLQSKVIKKKIDFWNFHSTSTSTETSDGLPYETYGSINLKKFTRPSFAHPKLCSERRSRNQNFFFFWVSLVSTLGLFGLKFIPTCIPLPAQYVSILGLLCLKFISPCIPLPAQCVSTLGFFGLKFISPCIPLPCLLYTSPSPRDMRRSRMPSSA